VCVIVDKLDKIGPEATIELLVEKEVAEEAASKIVKSLSLKSVRELKELTGDKGGAAVDELTSLFETAEAYGFADWILFDASVVRGLAYYTGIVFEGFDRKGELRAICGGGRYDKLLEAFGTNNPQPMVGFGFGDAVIMELLEVKGLLPKLSASNVEAVVFAMNEDLLPKALEIATSLRQAGRKVDMVLQPKKPKWVYKHADRLDAKYVVLLAPQEAEQGLVRVKNLESGDQDDVPFADVVSAVAL